MPPSEIKQEPMDSSTGPAAKRVKIEPGTGASSSSAAAPVVKNEPQQLDGLLESVAGAGAAAAGAGNHGEMGAGNGEIQEAGEAAGPAKQKLDEGSRITMSMNLLQGQVNENSAALYFICEAKKLKKVTQAVSLICRRFFYF